MERKKTRYPGVYERASSERKYQGKPDVSYDVKYRDGQGKQIFQTVGWRSEKMTAAEAANIRARLIKEAKEKPAPGLTFGQAWEIYKKDWLEAQKKACLYTDNSLYHAHIERRIGLLEMKEIGQAHIRAITTDMADLSVQTRKHALGLIRRVYRKMAEWKMYAGEVPTDHLVPGKVDNERKRFLTRAEAHMILCELDCRAPEFADVCRVSLYAGLRLGEIFRLQVQHVDLEAGIIYVMDAKAGSRESVISPGLKPVLERRMKGKKAGDYVFTQSDGVTPMRTINQTYVRVVADLGLNDGIEDARHRVVFHTLRHTFASWLVQAGVPLYTVADLMGHSTLAMTKRYAKLANDDRRTAVAMIPNI